MVEISIDSQCSNTEDIMSFLLLNNKYAFFELI